jgi:ribosomal protein S9
LKKFIKNKNFLFVHFQPIKKGQKFCMFRFAQHIRRIPKFQRNYVPADDSFILEHAGRIQKKISHDWTQAEVAKLFSPNVTLDKNIAEKMAKVVEERKEAAKHVLDPFVEEDTENIDLEDAGLEGEGELTQEEQVFQSRISFVQQTLKDRIYGEKGSKTPKGMVFPDIEDLEREKYISDLKKEDLAFWMDRSKRDAPLEPWHEKVIEKEELAFEKNKFMNPPEKVVDEDEAEMFADVPEDENVNDPGWEILFNLKPGQETETVWNPTFLKILWEIVGGDIFVRPEEFYEQIKFGTKQEAIFQKLKLIFPRLSDGATTSVMNKVLSILQRDQSLVRHPITESIRDLTQNLTESTAPVYFKWADRFKTLHPRGEAVEYALHKIMKKRVSGTEMKKAGEIAASLDPAQFPYETDFLYEVLRPLHEQKPMQSIQASKAKDRYPAIYGGKSFGWGKRKSSQATVKFEPGTGIFLINGIQHDNYFKNPKDLYSVFYPLHAMGSIKDFNVTAKVKGGGTTGQSEAVQLALSRAIVKFVPALYGHIKTLGLLTSDGRRVERKKPGQRKARRRFQWVKR